MAVERLDTDLETLAGAGRTEERDLSLPPHSIQAEEAVLGSILKNPASIVRVSDFLKPEDFYQQRNRHVFRAMLSCLPIANPSTTTARPTACSSRAPTRPRAGCCISAN